MVGASDNQANPKRNHKLEVFWRGPYEVLAGSPPEYTARMLGDDRSSQVYWRKMIRLAGPGLAPSEETMASALYVDRQRFLVNDFVDWVADANGDVDVLIDWKYHSEEERTREPLLQLAEDVTECLAAYV